MTDNFLRLELKELELFLKQWSYSIQQTLIALLIMNIQKW